MTIRENTGWPNTVISVFSALPDSASNITISNCILNNAVASNSVSYSVVSSTGFNPGLTIRKNTITRSQGINIVGNNNVGNFNPKESLLIAIHSIQL
ncbi:MAG: hypothetical protein IPK03_04955 [Bacteroidetes bacterium]|nr:hypothetical protein [Bacteroidota bacterium]